MGPAGPIRAMIERPMETRLIGVGIYSVPEASRLTHVSAPTIRRWIKGYSYRVGDTERGTPPVWTRQLADIEDEVSLGFLDLIEVRLIDAFRRRGVSWPTLKRAAEHAKVLFKTTHPFATHQFFTDGRCVFTELADQDKSLIDVADNQHTFKRLLAPYLEGLEFKDGHQVIRWWPLGERHSVLIDPQRSFGQPIVEREGVPTRILASAFKIQESVDAVAKWYEVSKKAVRDALKFEKDLAA